MNALVSKVRLLRFCRAINTNFIALFIAKADAASILLGLKNYTQRIKVSYSCVFSI
jgi:hypothetical protein